MIEQKARHYRDLSIISHIVVGERFGWVKAGYIAHLEIKHHCNGHGASAFHIGETNLAY